MRKLGFGDFDQAAYKDSHNSVNNVTIDACQLILSNEAAGEAGMCEQMKLAFSSTEFTLSFIASSLVICHYYAFTSLLPQLV